MSRNIVFEDERGRPLKILSNLPTTVVPRVGEMVVFGSEAMRRAKPQVFTGLVTRVNYYHRSDHLEVEILCVDDSSPVEEMDLRRRLLSLEGWSPAAPEAPV